MRTLQSSIYFYLLLSIDTIIAHIAEQPCSYNRSDYSLEWGYDAETDRVIFSLRAKTDHEQFLTGVAFGSKKHMDLLGVYVEEGKLGVIDGHVTRSGVIEEDESDNADSINFDYDKGVVSAEIARTLNAIESEDVDLSGCVTFYFPSGSSVFNRKHKSGTKMGKTIAKKVCDIDDKCSLNSNGERKSDRTEERSENESADSCSFSGKDFIVEWHFSPLDETVIFDITQSIVKGKRYTAIGIGTEMKDLDMAIIFLRDGVFEALNDYHANGHSSPKKDEIQDFKIHAKNTSTNERTHIQFSRKITTDDNKDYSLDGCVTLQFAINAGSYQNDVKIKKHDQIPIAHRVCEIRSKCVIDVERDRYEADEMSTTTSGEDETTDSDMSNDKMEEDTGTDQPDGSRDAVESTTEQITTSTISDDSAASSETDKSEPGAQYDANSGNETQPTTANKNGCPPDHEDLKICTKYFDDYYRKVAKWAKKHNETMEAQNWKACSLLQEAAHVPTLCCKIYTKKCANYIDNNSQ